MTTDICRIACTAVAAILLAGCASPHSGNRSPRTTALIMSGDVVSYGSPGFGPRVSISEVDGKPVAEPYGPLELAPGQHTVTLACDGSTNPHTLTMAAGEVYQFLVRTSGPKGCIATLARVRTTNP